MNEYRFDAVNHVHTLDGRPLIGTSSVLGVLNKPLVWWSSGLAVREFGCPDPKVLTKIKNKKATKEEITDLHNAAAVRLAVLKNMPTDEYVKLLDKAYRAHATTLKETAEEGTNLHEELSLFVRFKMSGVGVPKSNWDERIIPFIKWTDANVDRFLWSESHCYSRTHFLGGISDCGFIDKQGRMGILDFKSSKEAYWEMFLQCAAYDIQLEENGGFDAEGNRTLNSDNPADYYCVLPFGMAEPKVQENHDSVGCKENFLHALALYKAMPHD